MGAARTSEGGMLEFSGITCGAWNEHFGLKPRSVGTKAVLMCGGQEVCGAENKFFGDKILGDI